MAVINLDAMLNGRSFDTDALFVNRPSVSGNTGVVGAVVTAVTPNMGYTGIQWTKNGANITGATSPNYTLQAGDTAAGVVISFTLTGLSLIARAG